MGETGDENLAGQWRRTRRRGFPKGQSTKRAKRRESFEEESREPEGADRAGRRKVKNQVQALSRRKMLGWS